MNPQVAIRRPGFLIEQRQHNRGKLGLQFVHHRVRREVKDMLAYLRLLVNPQDVASFYRIWNTPRRSSSVVAPGPSASP